MKLALIGLAILLLPIRIMADAGAEVELSRVADIKIIGNTITRDSVIREALNLFPGQILDVRELRAAEHRLRRLGLFEADPKRGLGPTVVLERPGVNEPFKNIVVMVREKDTFDLRWELGLNAAGRPVLRLSAKELNFDATGWPRSLDDVREGRAFRGGGQKARLDLIQLEVFHGRLVFFGLTDSLLAPDGLPLRRPLNHR